MVYLRQLQLLAQSISNTKFDPFLSFLSLLTLLPAGCVIKILAWSMTKTSVCWTFLKLSNLSKFCELNGARVCHEGILTILNSHTKSAKWKYQNITLQIFGYFIARKVVVLYGRNCFYNTDHSLNKEWDREGLQHWSSVITSFQDLF